MSADEGVTRTQWLERGLAVGAGLASGGLVLGGLAQLAASAPSHGEDLTVLRFALALEELQADLYARALRDLRLQSDWLEYAQTVSAHERAHAAFLRRHLGGAADPSPRLVLTRGPSSAGEFQRLAVTLEDIGVAFYDGQVGNLTSGPLVAVSQVMSVESRHAAWARALAGQPPAPVASDVPADAAQVRDRLAQAGVSVG